MALSSRMDDVEPGMELEFWYPARNLIGVPVENVRRRVLVESVRRLDCEPLDASEFLQRPFLRRGRVLVSGIDLDLQVSRRFYLDACRGMKLPRFRLGIMEREHGLASVEYFGPRFRATVADRKLMADSIREFYQIADMSDRLQVVAVPQ